MKNTTDTLNSYVTDMLALEEHIRKALAGQVEDLDKYPAVRLELEQMHAMAEIHITTLQGLAKTKGGKGPGDMIKEAGSIVLGLGAAAIDLVRTESLPKNLRDDFTAFSLANAGYIMLETTALALGDRQVAEVAQRHFTDYARVVMTLNHIIPGAVLQFLKEEGHSVADTALAEVSRTIEEAWHQPAGVTAANLNNTWQK